MHFCRYTHEEQVLPEEVRALLEEEAYRAFCSPDARAAGPASAGAQPPAPAPAADPGRATGSRSSNQAAVPGPLKDTVHRMISTASFASYTRGNHELSERLAHEAVHWCNNQWSQLTNADPYQAELEQLERFAGSGSLEEARGIPVPATRPGLARDASALLAGPADAGPANPGTQADADAPALSGSPATPSRSGETSPPRGLLDTRRLRVETVARLSLIADRWRAELLRDRENHQRRELGRAMGSFVRELEALVPMLARAQSLVRDLFGTDDALWDSSRGAWEEANWDALEAAAGKLSTLPELDRLAEILGRSRTVTERRTTVRVRRQVTRRPVGLGKSEVTGVTFGDDLSSLLPSEVALLADPDTEDLLFAKLAHKELLQLDYRRERVVEHVRFHPVRETEEVVVPRGPLILCVDTSGSMLGESEQVAKAMTLALARRLLADRRPLHVIAFSTETRSLALSPDQVDLTGLCAFLGGSFHGGTDLRAALEESLRLLETQELRYADVLVISDFRVPKIADRFVTRIKRQQERGTLVHSLTVARGEVRDPLNIFDRSWLFNISEGMRGIRPDTLRALV